MISLIRAMQCTVVFGCLLMAIAIAYSHVPVRKRIPHVTATGIMILGGVITMVALAVGLYAVQIR